MMRAVSIIAVVVVSVLCVAVSAPSDVIASKSAPYFEDGFSRRVLANIDATLTRESEGARLRVVISAVGSGIDSVHGFEGVDGANHITAREMGELFGRGALRPVTGAHEGTVEIGRVGRIPERRFVPGQGFVETGTEHEYPLELILDSGVFGVGDHVLSLVVEDRERLRVAFDFDGSTGRIRAIESLGVDLLR